MTTYNYNHLTFIMVFLSDFVTLNSHYYYLTLDLNDLVFAVHYCRFPSYIKENLYYPLLIG